VAQFRHAGLNPEPAVWVEKNDSPVVSWGRENTFRMEIGLTDPDSGLVFRRPVGLFDSLLISGHTTSSFGMLGRLEWAWLGDRALVDLGGVVAPAPPSSDVGFARSRKRGRDVWSPRIIHGGHLTRGSVCTTRLASQVPSRFRVGPMPRCEIDPNGCVGEDREANLFGTAGSVN